MVTEMFGDMLFTPDAESLSEFRSPESLIRRAIISTKPPKEYIKSQESKAGAMGSQRGNDSATEAWGGEIPSFKSRITADFKREDLEDEYEEEEDLQDDNCAPEYRNLIAIHDGKGKGGLDDLLKVDPAKQMDMETREKVGEEVEEVFNKADQNGSMGESIQICFAFDQLKQRLLDGQTGNPQPLSALNAFL
ncbi:phosphoinositide phospholipase C 2-like protein, partial [Tanacetum coccineum]